MFGPFFSLKVRSFASFFCNTEEYLDIYEHPRMPELGHVKTKIQRETVPWPQSQPPMFMAEAGLELVSVTRGLLPLSVLGV